MFDIIAFDEKWNRKGRVDASIRDNVAWINVKDAIAFIQANKPKNEHWLIQILEVVNNG